MTETGSVSYGRTYNLGDYENERIDIRLPLNADESPDTIFEQARDFVESKHAETVARRERDRAIHHASSRIRDLDYTLEMYRRDASKADLVVSWDVPPPLVDTSDELANLQHGISVREAEQRALAEAIERHRKAVWQQREREKAQQAGLADDDDDWDEDDESEDNAV